MATGSAVRRLGAGDVQDFRTIRLAALAEAPDAFGSVHAREAVRSAAEHAETLASSTVFGAYAADAIVGMVGWKQEQGPKTSHKGFVWGFYVAPPARRAGIGTALLAAIVASARERVEQLTLTVVSDNAGAIALYERFGFAAYGVEPRAQGRQRICRRGPDGPALGVSRPSKEARPFSLPFGEEEPFHEEVSSTTTWRIALNPTRQPRPPPAPAPGRQG